MIDPDAFRDALSRFASGVTVVTVANEGKLHGMTASSFASVSLDPPRVVVCLDKSSRTRALLADTFAVNILSADQEDAARAFAGSGEKPFGKMSHELGISGAPLLHGCIAWVECETSSIVDGGDHDMIIGNVIGCRVEQGQPLLYFDRAYRSLA